MDINEFQNKLKDIQTLALNNGKQVRADLVEKFFGEEGMDQDKLQKVYDYLEVQGIHVTGRKEEESRKQEEAVSVRKKKESVPLTSEEEEYLRDYLKTFGFEDNLLDRQELLRRCAAGEASARESLIRTCQRELRRFFLQIFWERQIWLFSPPWIHWKRSGKKSWRKVSGEK